MNSGISVYRVCGAPFSESNQTEVRAFYCRSTFTLTGEPAIQGSQKKRYGNLTGCCASQT